MTEALDRKLARLRNAERRLEAAQRHLLNPSATSDGNSWGASADAEHARRLNEGIREAHGVAALEAEITQLREELGPLAEEAAPGDRPSGLLAQLSRWLRPARDGDPGASRP